jgi:hypothetical protein
MESIPIESARILRDGGIHAVAALNAALADAITDIPVDRQQEIKRAVGHAMAAVLDATVESAVRAYPELEPDDATWAAVARARAARLASS